MRSVLQVCSHYLGAWTLNAPNGSCLGVDRPGKEEKWVDPGDGGIFRLFQSEAEAKDAIATSPRWWPKQPWELE